jgi:hypothetical protein
MTKEQKAKYLKNEGDHCPYCGSVNIESDTAKLSDYADEYRCATTCYNCRKEWTDIYRLADTDFETE